MLSRLLRCALVAAVAASTPMLRAQDWPQLLGPARNGVYNGPPIAASFSAVLCTPYCVPLAENWTAEPPSRLH